MPKLNILFVHSSYPAQFSLLHRYLNESGLAESSYLTSAACHRKVRDRVPNVFAFEPDGSADTSYFYTRRVEKAYRISKGAFLAVQNLVTAKHIDVIVAHSVLGCPVLWFDRLELPIVSYIEFPSFQAYGFDPQYPPTEEEIQADSALGMLSLHTAHKSETVLTPSEYVRRMLPECVSHKTFVQIEGLDPRFLRATGAALSDRTAVASPVLERLTSTGGRIVGFMARTLSSEKGYEHFIRISKRLLESDPTLHFLIIGGTSGAQYGFEKGYLERTFPGITLSFRDYIIRKHAIDLGHYHFAGFVENEALLREYIDAADVFLYPLQFGSGNWILLELLQHGQLVIASDRCHVPEIIRHRHNGLLCPYEDLDAWVNTTLDALKAPERYQTIRDNARTASEQYDIAKVAPRILRACGDAVVAYAARR